MIENFRDWLYIRTCNRCLIKITKLNTRINIEKSFPFFSFRYKHTFFDTYIPIFLLYIALLSFIIQFMNSLQICSIDYTCNYRWYTCVYIFIHIHTFIGILNNDTDNIINVIFMRLGHFKRSQVVWFLYKKSKSVLIYRSDLHRFKVQFIMYVNKCSGIS